ncbi:MAG: hypothetical protein ACE14V_09950 [bacterium]
MRVKKGKIKQTIDISTSMEIGPQSEQAFPVKKEYARCITALNRTGILNHLLKSESMGVIGIDKKKYPIPTLEQVSKLFAQNRKLVARKVLQGFNRLVLTPLAIPIPKLIERLQSAIISHAASGTIYRTRRSKSSRLIPVRVNQEKQVWVWDTLKQVIDTDKLIYFPREYSNYHQGQTKLAVINNPRICGVPGWSIGLIENLPTIPSTDKRKIIGGRKQLEIGYSPREYLAMLREERYRGETGKTLEDFLTEFLIHLKTANEVSYDGDDLNALWCLGQYYKIPYAEVVPAGRWIRSIGRLRLDSHRTGNKRCTKNVGVSTIVRLGK